MPAGSPHNRIPGESRGGERLTGRVPYRSGFSRRQINTAAPAASGRLHMPSVSGGQSIGGGIGGGAVAPGTVAGPVGAPSAAAIAEAEGSGAGTTGAGGAGGGTVRLGASATGPGSASTATGGLGDPVVAEVSTGAGAQPSNARVIASDSAPAPTASGHHRPPREAPLDNFPL
jgi:hypothetical protein